MQPGETGERAPRTAVLAPEVPAVPPHDTVVGALWAGAREDAPYLTFHEGGRAVPFGAAAALDAAIAAASALAARGVRRGDPVVLLLPGSADFVATLLGSMLLGAVPVPLAAPMTFGAVDRFLSNLARVVEGAGARIAVTTARMRDAVRAGPRLATLREVTTPDELRSGPGSRAPLPSLDGTDLALLQYTSGTTGSPRGARITHRALVSNAYGIAHALELGPHDVGVSWLPPFHDMGLIGALLTPLCHPYPVHLLRTEAFLMRPAAWLSLLSRVGGTVSAAPSFGYELCARKHSGEEARLDRWRAAVNGAEPVRPATCRRFAERMRCHGYDPAAMTPAYGLAEATLAVTFERDAHRTELTLDGDALRAGRVRPGRDHVAVSVGRPVAGVTVRIAGDGAALDQDTVGEIEVTGPGLMDGYHRDEAASAAAFRGGWLRTGDLGFVHDGRLHVTGRARDLVIKAGRNVHPEDVERVAAEVDGAGGAVAAFGAPNDETGTDDLCVLIEARAGGEPGLDARVRGELLAALDVKADVVRVVPIGSLPRTTSGKVRRRDCAALLDRRGS